MLLPIALASALLGQAQPAKMTAEQDYQDTLKMLGITSVRMYADGMNPNAPNAANRDEAKAEKWGPCPDLMTFQNGKPVKSLKDWQARRKELLSLFDENIYGKTPTHTPKVTWEVLKTESDTIGGIAVTRKAMLGKVDNSEYPAAKSEIPVVLVLPARAAKPVPVILEFGFGGMRMPPRPANAPQPAEKPWTQQVLERGYGYAILTPTSVQADSGAGLRDGVIGIVNHGKLRKPDDWGALKAWAWAASRTLDEFQHEPLVDAKHVAIEGISRYGKATLVTMVYDPRFAAAFVGSSGSGGAKLWRRDFGERETNLGSSGEYHWMTPNFIRYSGPMTPADMPIDQHEFIALCAPRPVFISCGSPNVEGLWLDDYGMFKATWMASPAWTLFGKKGIAADKMPAEGDGLMDGDLAFRQHHGGHTNGPNWETFLNWVGRYFPRPLGS